MNVHMIEAQYSILADILGFCFRTVSIQINVMSLAFIIILSRVLPGTLLCSVLVLVALCLQGKVQDVKIPLQGRSLLHKIIELPY